MTIKTSIKKTDVGRYRTQIEASFADGSIERTDPVFWPDIESAEQYVGGVIAGFAAGVKLGRRREQEKLS